MSAPTEKQALKSALQAVEAWWTDMGVDIPPLPAAPKPKRTSTAKSGRYEPKRPTRPFPAPPPSLDLGEQIAKAEALAKSAPTLDALKGALADFDAGVLSDHARQMVFARGNPDADIMVIGEAPGREEDIQGKPFVGPAGQLLDKMFAAIDMAAEALYITNVCNWRPPKNRNPSEEELALCAPFITRHMELIAPKLIVIVGGVSLQALTGKTGIMKTRGRWQEIVVGGTAVPAMPIYHPAFLLRRPELKRDAWRDLLAIRERLNTL